MGIERFHSYIHHARIVCVNPEGKLLLMGETLQADQGKFPEEKSDIPKENIVKTPRISTKIMNKVTSEKTHIIQGRGLTSVYEQETLNLLFGLK